jgi:hypothetical protein
MSDVTAHSAAPAGETDPPVVGGTPERPTAETPTTAPGQIPDAGPPTSPGPSGPPPWQGPPPGYWGGGWATPGSPAQPRFGFLRSALLAWLVAAVLALTVVGLAVALALTNRPDSVRVVTPFPGSTTPVLPSPGFFGVGGGAVALVGTVASLGSNTFTVTAVTGQTITVDEQPSTRYLEGASTASSSAVVPGARVAVEGTRSGNAVEASRVIVFGAGLPGFGRP